jgi:hypothetical protein
MRIIKGICGFILFLCLVAIMVPAMMFEADTIDMRTAISRIVVIALTAIIAFVGYIATEGREDHKVDFIDFIHEEYLGRNNTKKKRP